MSDHDVYIGKGKLAGKGVYAARDFAEGEVIKKWNLKELTQKEFNDLPKDEHKFVHSFWAKMYLFPEPSRYTNHSPSPNTEPNFDLMHDVATQNIKKDDMITTNATDEIKFELTTFLKAYEEAANSRNFDNVEPLIAKGAVFEFTNGTFTGISEIRKAFEDTYKKIREETYSLTDLEWVKTGYRNAECKYNFKSDGIVDGKRQIYEGTGASKLKRVSGNWRITYEKLQKT